MPENSAYEGFKQATEALTEALTTRLTGLTQQTETVLRKLQKQSTRSTRWIYAIVASLILSATGLAVIGFTVHRLDSQQHQVAQIESRLAHRSNVLCPLYTLFIQADTPQARKQTPPAQRAQQAHAFQVIRQGYRDLGCIPHLDRNGHLPPEVVGKEPDAVATNKP